MQHKVDSQIASKSTRRNVATTCHTLSTKISKTNPDEFNVGDWVKNPEGAFRKLEIAMDYLQFLELDEDTDKALQEFQDIMQHLQQEFKEGGKLFIPWTRFLDVIGHVQRKFFEENDDMREKMETLVLNLLTQDKTTSSIDWRIAKKILSVPHIFPNGKKSRLLSLVSKESLLKDFQREIGTSLEDMVWLPSSSRKALGINCLQKLQTYLFDKSFHDRLIQALAAGRFDKSIFGLSHTLVCGEDGGLFLLLNRMSKEQQEEMVRDEIVTKNYLHDKIVRPDQQEALEDGKINEKEGGSTYDKIVIGQGGFGKVRFALNLFRGSKANPGDIICVKKTKDLTTLAKRLCQDLLEKEWSEADEEDKAFCLGNALGDATIPTLSDYFGGTVAEKVFAPHIFDMTIVSEHPQKDTTKLSDNSDHRKAYIMMEMVPQNSATVIFSDPKYQVWKYQKPYLIDTLQTTLGLLNEQIAFTDLKPDNALYNPNLLQTTMIDMGGTIKINTATDSADNFNKKKIAQTTPGYRPPELEEGEDDDENTTINLPKALAFTCGVIIKEVALENSDYNNKQEIQELVDKLTHTEPNERISIEEAISQLNNMGDNSYKEDVVLRHYIAKVNERIETNRSSISLNEDILQTKELYLTQNVTSLDPEKYKSQETIDLFKKFDNFLSSNQDKQQIMVVFGSAGSGKSIALQLKFIEVIRNWESGQPLPVYFNLANGIELKMIIDSMNRVLGTHITFQDLRRKGVHLYIDSFDEGLGLDSSRRETLVKEYMKELFPLNEKEATTKLKLLISCRTDYLENESNYKWFTPQVDAFDKLLTVYIAPIDYNGHANLKQMIGVYAKHNSKGGAFVDETLNKIAVLRLKDMITTGFMFYIILEVLPQLNEEESKDDDKDNARRGISKQDIFFRYISHYQVRELQRIKEKEQLQLLLKKSEFIVTNKNQEEEEKRQEQKESVSIERTLSARLREFGKYIAVQLHLQGRFRLDQGFALFQALCYDNTAYFKKQTLSYLLKLLPLKIETKFYSDSKSKKQSQEVKLGFIHDTIKNSYLLEAIQEEMKKTNGNSRILSSQSIVADQELVRFIADAASSDTTLRQHLRKAIDLTKTDKSECAGIYAANSITILVAANYSFTCQDLSNINIRSANIRNGMFSGVDFTGADLSYTNLGNIQADYAKLVNTNLKAAKFGILPDLGHYYCVNGVSFSPDGKNIASGSGDRTVKIWETQTSKCIKALQGHTHDVSSVSFSPDGKYIASGSHDKTVKIWEVQTSNCITTLEGHTGGVLSVSFSSEGKYIASGSIDKTVKIWEVQTSKCITTLQGHTGWVNSVSFSPDGKHIASGSGDGVKIWEVLTSNCITTLKNPRGGVGSVRFSPDGKYIASGLDDDLVKIWEVQTSKCIITLRGHAGRVTSVRFSPDGKYIASGSWDNAVKIWEVQTSKCIKTLQGHTHHVTSLSFSPDGKYIVSGSGDKTVKIWEVQTSNCIAILQGHTGEGRSVCFSGDGKYLASGSNDKTVKIWETQTSKCITTLQGHTWWVNSVSFSEDGKYTVSGGDQTVKIWETQTSKCITTLQGHTGGVLSVSFSPDGKYIVSGSGIGTVRIWEVLTSKCIITLEDHKPFVASVSFSPDGKYIVSGSGDKTVKIWEVQTSKCITILQGHTGGVLSVRFSPDGKYIASGSGDKTVKIWEVQTSQYITTTLRGHTEEVNSVCFSGDGKYLASGSNDKTVNIWEVQTFKWIKILQGHTSGVLSVSFSPDGKYIASGSSDSTVRIYVNINGNWLCDKIFSSTEYPLTASKMIIKQVIVSQRNKMILEQLTKEKITEDKIAEVDETMGELIHESTYARAFSNELSDLLLKNSAKYEALERQKLEQLTLCNITMTLH